MKFSRTALIIFLGRVSSQHTLISGTSIRLSAGAFFYERILAKSSESEVKNEMASL